MSWFTLHRAPLGVRALPVEWVHPSSWVRPGAVLLCKATPRGQPSHTRLGLGGSDRCAHSREACPQRPPGAHGLLPLAPALISRTKWGPWHGGSSVEVWSLPPLRAEKQDVHAFLLGNLSNGGILELMMRYLKSMGHRFLLRWPPGLAEVVLSIYHSWRRHSASLPNPLLRDCGDRHIQVGWPGGGQVGARHRRGAWAATAGGGVGLRRGGRITGEGGSRAGGEQRRGWKVEACCVLGARDHRYPFFQQVRRHKCRGGGRLPKGCWGLPAVGAEPTHCPLQPRLLHSVPPRAKGARVLWPLLP